MLNRVMGEFHTVSFSASHLPLDAESQEHHNHMKKDYSHMWVVEEDKDRMTAGLNASYYMRWAFPVLAWPIYLYGGQADGGHLIQYGRLWKDRGVSDRAHGYISGAVSAATMYALWKCLGSDVVRVYAMPWLVFSFFLFTVTLCTTTKTPLFTAIRLGRSLRRLSKPWTVPASALTIFTTTLPTDT